jgi:hypothetical protein
MPLEPVSARTELFAAAIPLGKMLSPNRRAHIDLLLQHSIQKCSTDIKLAEYEPLMRTRSTKHSERTIRANMGKGLLEIDTLLLPMAPSNQARFVAAISLALKYKPSGQSPLALW